MRLSCRLVPLALWLLTALSACSNARAPLVRGGPDSGSSGQDGSAEPDVGNDADPDAARDYGEGTPLLVRSAFEVTGSLKLTPQGGSPATFKLPTQQSFVLVVDPQSQSLVVTREATATRVAATNVEHVVFETKESIYLPLPASVSPCGASINYESLRLTSGPHGITGTASGTAQIVEEDVGYLFKAELTFSGVPDKQGPSVSVAGPIDPLAGATLALSEAISAGATARLVLADEKIDLLPVTTAELVTAFAVPPKKALRYGAAYTVEIARWQDLAGNLGVEPATIVTTAVPELLSEDGFEAGGATVGGALVVDTSVLPPISGARSAAVASNYVRQPLLEGATNRLSGRLSIQAGDTMVRVALRPFVGFRAETAWRNVRVRVAAPGGDIVEAALPAPTEVSGSSSRNFGETQTFAVPLPQGASSEVVLDIATPSISVAGWGCGPPLWGVGYLIDDLGVE